MVALSVFPILIIRVCSGTMAESATRPFYKQAWFVQAVRWGGYAALGVALVYLGVAIARLDLSGVIERLSIAAWLVSALSAVAYGALLVLLARAWAGCASGTTDLPWSTVLETYGPGVLAKYIPGSVFQYASRQVLGAQLGWGHGGMARASLAEAAIHIPAALGVAAMLVLSGGLAGVALFVLAGALLARQAKTVFLQAIGWQIMFFGGFGTIAYVLAAHAIGLEQPAAIAAMFMLAWIAGFLVPVAPGGIGIRESVLLVLCAPYEQAGVIALFAILTRLVTTAGDAICGLAAYGYSLRTRSNRQASV